MNTKKLNYNLIYKINASIIIVLSLCLFCLFASAILTINKQFKQIIWYGFSWIYALNIIASITYVAFRVISFKKNFYKDFWFYLISISTLLIFITNTCAITSIINNYNDILLNKPNINVTLSLWFNLINNGYLLGISIWLFLDNFNIITDFNQVILNLRKKNMKKTLLIYSRICPNESLHTIKIFEAFQKMDNIETYKLGTDQFDPIKEQEYVKQFDNIIFLFTINWFNIPWNLSRYFAEVFRTGNFNIEGKNVYFIVTTGSNEQLYTHESAFKNTIEEYFNNSFSMIKRLKGNFIKLYPYYDCVNYDENKLNNFINFLTTEFKKI